MQSFHVDEADSLVYVASVQDIKRRISSVRNTRKITRALELVAAAKLKRAQTRIEDMRPYADRMLELMAGTARASSSVRGLPLLQKRESEQNVAIVPLTGDRGLAGAFNSQILRRALALDRELRGRARRCAGSGSGGAESARLRFRRLELSGEFAGFTDQPRYADAQAIAHRVAELYTNGEVDRVVLVYNQFESALVQKVTVAGPSAPLREPPRDRRRGAGRRRAARRLHLRAGARADPRAAAAGVRRDRALPGAPRIRRLEHGARMTAMRNASKNAEELIDTLTLPMNRARQAEITQEILEVVAGADALTT